MMPRAASTVRPALFIDLTGVLLDTAPARGPLPGLRGGVGGAPRLLDRLDYRIVVLAPCALDRRQAAHLLLARERVPLAGCCSCDATSRPCAACPPAPAGLVRAAREHGVALGASWLLGREAHHLAAAQGAGCKTVLIGMDGETDAWPSAWPACGARDGPPAYIARDIVDAALAIVRIDGGT